MYGINSQNLMTAAISAVKDAVNDIDYSPMVNTFEIVSNQTSLFAFNTVNFIANTDYSPIVNFSNDMTLQFKLFFFAVPQLLDFYIPFIHKFHILNQYDSLNYYLFVAIACTLYIVWGACFVLLLKKFRILAPLSTFTVPTNDVEIESSTIDAMVLERSALQDDLRRETRLAVGHSQMDEVIAKANLKVLDSKIKMLDDQLKDLDFNRSLNGNVEEFIHWHVAPRPKIQLISSIIYTIHSWWCFSLFILPRPTFEMLASRAIHYYFNFGFMRQFVKDVAYEVSYKFRYTMGMTTMYEEICYMVRSWMPSERDALLWLTDQMAKTDWELFLLFCFSTFSVVLTLWLLSGMSVRYRCAIFDTPLREDMRPDELKKMNIRHDDAKLSLVTESPSKFYRIIMRIFRNVAIQEQTYTISYEYLTQIFSPSNIIYGQTVEDVIKRMSHAAAVTSTINFDRHAYHDTNFVSNTVRYASIRLRHAANKIQDF
jgi:hypothetical protein